MNYFDRFKNLEYREEKGLDKLEVIWLTAQNHLLKEISLDFLKDHYEEQFYKIVEERANLDFSSVFDIYRTDKKYNLLILTQDLFGKDFELVQDFRLDNAISRIKENNQNIKSVLFYNNDTCKKNRFFKDNKDVFNERRPLGELNDYLDSLKWWI
ncbi:hypothetical protein KY334_03125 [Candidatus Woesearchaeota archaeon]|nr:hypothetical protein [Candidatus Woesearchaeota archaeon]